MNDYATDLNELKEALADVLEDNKLMCQQGIKKSNILLKMVEKLDVGTIENIKMDITKMFHRINMNIAGFQKKCDKVVDKFTRVVENNNRPKRKSNLSLRRNNDSKESDTDLTNSDVECIESSVSNAQVQDAQPSSDKDEGENKDVESNEAEEISDDDSQTDAMPVQNFDVSVASTSKDDSMEVSVLKESLREFEKVDQGQKRKNDSEVESQSFDFDDDEDLNTKLEKMETSDEEALRQSHQNNHELLELLSKATDNPRYPMYVTTDQEGEEALKAIEEDEVSESSLSDSDATELYSLVCSDSEWELSEASEDEEDEEMEKSKCKEPIVNLDDVEDEAEKAEQPKCKELSIKLDRVDEFSDEAIDRLCNLHQLNKRQCTRVLRPSTTSKPKRQRLLSTSSSESDSSTDGSTTPDLNLDLLPSPPLSPGPNHNEELADALVNNIDTSGDEVEEVSSDTDIDEENREKKKKKLTKKRQKVEEEEVDKEDVIEPRRRTGSWGKDPLLWSDSESEEEEKPKPKLVGSPTILDEEPTIISDSMSDSDSDVTFVSEVDDDDDGGGDGRGRRNIRKIIPENELNVLTQQAKSEETQRIQRLEEHSKTLELVLSQHEDFVLDFDVNTKRPLITVDANLVRKLKPHQKDGIQFMWEACYESVEMLKKANSGTGCILAHCMGLGKTLQVIVLVHTLFTYEVTNTKHVLVVCPLSTVSNWQNEFEMAFQLLPKRPKIPLYFVIQHSAQQKCKLVEEWRAKGGVLVMGYDAFRMLSNGMFKFKMTEQQVEEQKKRLYEALIDPGPDLVVCDEGHLVKNSTAQRSQSLMKVRTKRRILLTGTPLQNNLSEYYYMVDFVKTHLLGTHSEYCNRFVNPIMNGQYHDSRPEDIKIMKKRTHVLIKLLKKTIHRVESRVLQSYLPEINDYAIFVKLEPVQVELYKKYIELAKNHGSTSTKLTCFFQDFRMTKYLTLHPYAIQLYYKDVKNKKGKKKKAKETIIVDGKQVVVEEAPPRINEGWYDDLFPADVAESLEYSAKLRVILAIINEAVRNGEKILVFAHQLPELDVVEYFLKRHGTADFRCWTSNRHYLRLDGDVSPTVRSSLCDRFNTDPDVMVFLISHGVGGLGLNLTGASRVILIGSNHNPSVDTQSIYRVYRFGQTKKCFVYRVLAKGAMEEKIYQRCVVKSAVAGTVVDKCHFERHFKCRDLQFMYEHDFDSIGERPMPSVPQDKLLAKLLQNNDDIYKYYEHSALLENRPEEELDDEDKRLAWDEFKREEEAEENVRNVAVPPQEPPPPLIIPTVQNAPQVANRPSVQNRPLILNRPPIQNRPLILNRDLIQNIQNLQSRLQMQNANPSSSTSSNGLTFYPLGPNGNVVVNPMNTSFRGGIQRGARVGNNMVRNPVPRANMQQASVNQNRPSSMYRPYYTGYNRNVPVRPPNRQSNPFLRLMMEQNNNRQSNQANRNVSTPNRNVVDMLRAVRRTPVPMEVVNLDEGPSISGEFNYALNKVV